MNKDIIEERITELMGILTIKISQSEKLYADMTEKEKIPFRVMQAEIRALKEFSVGENLDYWAERCIAEEQYCACAGIERVKKWIENNS